MRNAHALPAVRPGALSETESDLPIHILEGRIERAICVDASEKAPHRAAVIKKLTTNQDLPIILCCDARNIVGGCTEARIRKLLMLTSLAGCSFD